MAAAALAAALTIAAPASAATLGSTGAATTGNCGSDLLAWETDTAYTVPADGIIMSMATNTPTPGKHFTFKILRPSGAGVTVVASSGPIVEVAGTNTVTMNAAVKAGDQLGFYSSDGADCAISTSGGGSVAVKGTAGGDPAVGANITPDGAGAAQLALSATFEPDADHDGFGDETQDSCPTDPGIHTGPCTIDMSAAQSVTPTTIGIGDVAVATVTIANGSTGTAQGVTTTAKVTPGLQVVSMIPGNGCSFSPDLSCTFGTLTGGASTVAAVVVRGVTTGAQSLTTTATASGSDPNTANNAVTTAVTVEKRVTARCNVPSLKGLSKAISKRLLAAAGCKLGKVTKKKSAKGKKGTVIKQSPKAGSKLAPGSKVAVTLKR
ncbi:MAG TPA: PASTA domain-containing protein [Solirubrobacteraceae bacterium]|nr:PASTA domain-containing protein [Solirubrobacteraceae bacterium]